MRAATFDDVFNLDPGRLFAIWEGNGFASEVFVKGENGPRGELMVRELFSFSREARQDLHDGKSATLQASEFARLSICEEDRFVIFEKRDLDVMLPQLTAAASGIEIVFQGGRCDGFVRWQSNAPQHITVSDRTTSETLREIYLDTGETTAEGYRIFRFNARKSRDL